MVERLDAAVPVVAARPFVARLYKEASVQLVHLAFRQYARCHDWVVALRAAGQERNPAGAGAGAAPKPCGWDLDADAVEVAK